MLRSLIDSSGLSKNYIIKNTRIDKSTFFQILNGKRSITSEQFRSVISLIQRETDLKDIPDEVFDTFQIERLGEERFKRRVAIRKFINGLSDKYRLGKSERVLPEEGEFVKCFVPIPGIYSLVLNNLVSAEVLINSDSSFGSIEERLNLLGKIIGMLLDGNLSYIQVYAQIQEIDCGIYSAIAYPYYAVSKKRLERITFDMRSKECDEDINLISEYISAFDKATGKAVPLISYFDSDEAYKEYMIRSHKTGYKAMLSSELDLNEKRLRIPSNISIYVDNEDMVTIHSKAHDPFIIKVQSVQMQEAFSDYVTHLWEDNAILTI